MPVIVKNADYATFINVFKCKPRDQHEVVRINAEIIDRVAVRCHGFISASIHHSTDGHPRIQLPAVGIAGAPREHAGLY
jgi:hypothetical protein